MPEPTPQLRCLATLTNRELEVVCWVARGKSNGDIGRILVCSEGTVKKHVQRIFRKFGVETRTAAADVYWQAMAEAARAAAQGPSRDATTDSAPSL